MKPKYICIYMVHVAVFHFHDFCVVCNICNKSIISITHYYRKASTRRNDIVFSTKLAARTLTKCLY